MYKFRQGVVSLRKRNANAKRPDSGDICLKTIPTFSNTYRFVVFKAVSSLLPIGGPEFWRGQDSVLWCLIECKTREQFE